MLSIISPSVPYGLFFPPEEMRIGIRKRPESPCTCSYIRSSLDQYLNTDSSGLSVRDTVCPSGCDVLRS